MILTGEQLQMFNENGFIVIGPLFTEPEIETLRERIDLLASGHHPSSSKIGIRLEAKNDQKNFRNVAQQNKVWQLMNVTQHDELLANHARHPKILSIVEQLLGSSDIKLFGDQTLMKPAFHGNPVSWHQDSGYWTNIAPPAIINCWTALDDANLENGCVKYIPSSHKRGVLPHVKKHDDFLHVQEFDPAKAVPAEVPVGWCAFHHSCTIHGSGPNTSPNRRRGFITSYMSADSKWTGDPLDKPEFPLLRGQEYDDCV